MAQLDKNEATKKLETLKKNAKEKDLRITLDIKTADTAIGVPGDHGSVEKFLIKSAENAVNYEATKNGYEAVRNVYGAGVNPDGAGDLFNAVRTDAIRKYGPKAEAAAKEYSGKGIFDDAVCVRSGGVDLIIPAGSVETDSEHLSFNLSHADVIVCSKASDGDFLFDVLDADREDLDRFAASVLADPDKGGSVEIAGGGSKNATLDGFKADLERDTAEDEIIEQEEPDIRK